MLLATGPIGIAAGRGRHGHELVYGLCLVASLLIGLDAAAWLLRPERLEQTAILPFGLPWLEAHFRLDALAAYFLLLVNLLAAIVAVFALGYGSDEKE
ncbi:MAG TPA: hydrogenase 4 subunit B, partial [Dongiaceae bacterium]